MNELDTVTVGVAERELVPEIESEALIVKDSDALVLPEGLMLGDALVVDESDTVTVQVPDFVPLSVSERVLDELGLPVLDGVADRLGQR